MSLFNIFDVAGSGMSAQQLRLNLVASNLANAQTVSSSGDATYKSRQPVFSAMLNQFTNKQTSVGVRVDGVVESQEPLRKDYRPNHPKSDKDGFIYMPNVNSIGEMANMISASRSFQTNVEIASTSKKMAMKLIQLGK